MKKLLLSLLFIALFFGAIAQKSDATLTTDAQTNIQTGVYNPAKAYTMFKELIDNKVNQMVTVNGHALTGNITLTASDVGAIGLSSLSGVAPIGYNTGTGAISIATATTSTTGALTNTDWNTFNGKANTSVGGDLSGSLPNPTVAKINGNTVPSNASGVLTNNGSGTLTWAPAGGTGTVTSVTSADGNATVATTTTTPVITIVSAPKWTTGRTVSITGDVTATTGVLDGTGNVTGSATVTKLNGTSLAGLSTGILKITTGTGVPSTAIAADFPTLNQSTTGNAATVTTNANLTGDVTSSGNATTYNNTVPINKGGTGQTTANTAFNALAPSQTSNSGKVLSTDGTNTSWISAGGTGTVTSVAVTTANGVSGSVANPTAAANITLTLGAITPTSVNGVTLSGSSTPTLAVTGTTTVSGSNTGDYPTVSAALTNLGPLPTGYSTTGASSYRQIEDTDLSVKNKRKLPFYGAFWLFGDSYSADSNVAGYVGLLQTQNNVPVLNQASGGPVSGKGIYVAGINSYATTPKFLNHYPTLLMVGFNDIRQNGAATATVNKVIGGHYAVITNAWLRNAVAASAMTAGGTWSAFSTITGKGANLGGTSMQSTASGSTLTYVTTDITDNIVVYTYGTDGVTYNYGAFTVSIDGTVVQTFNPNGNADLKSDGTNDNGRSPFALVYTNLSNQTHTVLITTTTTNTTVVDAVGYMQEPGKCPPVFIGSPARMNSTGYATAPANSSDAAVTTLKLAIKTVTNVLADRPIVFVDLDTYYNPLTGVSGDNIHPAYSSTGYATIAQAFQDVILPSATSTDVLKLAPTTTYTGGSAGDPSYLAGYQASGTHSSFWSINQHPINNSFFSTNGSSSIQLTEGAGTAGINLYTSNTAAKTLRWGIDGAGILKSSNSTTGTVVNLNNTSTVAYEGDGTLRLIAGATENASQVFTARATSTAIYSANTGTAGHIFYWKSGLTLGNTFSLAGSEIMRMSGTQNVLIGATTESAKLYVSQAALTGANGVPGLRVDYGAHTTLTASTEFPDFISNGSVTTAQWATGTLATQRFNWFKGRTANFVASSTLTDGYNVYADDLTFGGFVAGGSRKWSLGLVGNFQAQANSYFGGTGVLPTAKAHFAAGTATANTAPLKLTAGTNLTVVENGAVEMDANKFYASTNSVRYDVQHLAGSYSGTGTATTTYTVTIGQTMPNTTYKVDTTPTNSLSAVLMYVTNKTTTTFDVTFTAGLTGTVAFDWILTP